MVTPALDIQKNSLQNSLLVLLMAFDYIDNIMPMSHLGDLKSIKDNTLDISGNIDPDPDSESYPEV